MRSWGFVGGGRATRILLEGFRRAGALPDKVVVSDTDTAALELLKGIHQGIETTTDNRRAASQELVFLSVPFTVMEEVLNQIKGALKEKAIVISLAPKYRISQLSELLGGFSRIARMIPNAPSIINRGFNPVHIPEQLSKERENIVSLLRHLGDVVEVEEKKLEAFVIASAALPTYFWFQLMEVEKIAQQLGLSKDEAHEAVYKATSGALELLYTSGMDRDYVLDLIPLKPLRHQEEQIKDILRERLLRTYQKIR